MLLTLVFLMTLMNITPLHTHTLVNNQIKYAPMFLGLHDILSGQLIDKFPGRIVGFEQWIITDWLSPKLYGLDKTSLY